MLLWAVVLGAQEDAGKLGLKEYAELVRDHDWATSQMVEITNPDEQGGSLAVVIQLTDHPLSGYGVIDAQGYPVPSQVEDLDRDGVLDRVVFIANVPGRSQKTFRVLGSYEPLPQLPPAFELSEVQLGSWIPLRFEATTNATTAPGAGVVSAYNLKLAQRLIDSLENKHPMTIVRGVKSVYDPGSPVQAPFQLTVGNESGLIEGLYPATMRGFAGSYLREYVHQWTPEGSLEVLANGPVRVVLRWTGVGTRTIVLYCNGRLETIWDGARPALQLVTGAHPYRYRASGEDDVVRYSQLINRRRALAGAQRWALWGYHNASLLVTCRGLRPTEARRGYA